MDTLYAPEIDPDLNDPVNRLEAEIEARFQHQAQRVGLHSFPLTDQPRMTIDGLVNAYLETFPTTVYAAGRYWRCDDLTVWSPLPERNFTAEVLKILEWNPNDFLQPDPRGLTTLTAMLQVALDIVPAGRWDNPAGALPLLHALLDLQTGALTPYLRRHYIATTLPYDYDPLAQAPAWQRFLSSSVPAAAEFLQEFAGYCLTPAVHHELSLWVHGPPASGKSTLLHGLQTLLGPCAAELSLDDLGRRRLDPAALHGKTLLVSHEPPANSALLRPLSALVSGEALTFVPPHGRPITYRVNAKLALAFNALPSLEVPFASVYRRAALVVLPPLPPGAHDPLLKARIAEEGPGLLNWALAGLRRLQQRGRFDPPATMLEAADRLRLTHIAPAAFVAECCHIHAEARAQAQPLHRAYVTWCASRGLPAISARALAAEWERLGFERIRIRGISHWCGLALASEAMPAETSSLAPGVTASLPLERAQADPPAGLPAPAAEL